MGNLYSGIKRIVQSMKWQEEHKLNPDESHQ